MILLSRQRIWLNAALRKAFLINPFPWKDYEQSRALPELLASVIGFRVARASSVYISNIASEIDPTLKGKVDDLLKELKGQTSLLMKYKRKQPAPIWPSELVVTKIAGNNERMYKLATEVIGKAADIQKRSYHLNNTTFLPSGLEQL